jgi:hypothetical protein
MGTPSEIQFCDGIIFNFPFITDIFALEWEKSKSIKSEEKEEKLWQRSLRWWGSCVRQLPLESM